MTGRITPSTKLLLITVATTITATIFATRYSQSIWPGIPLTVGVAALIAIALITRGHTRPVSLALVGIMVLAAFHRLAIYLYPASMIGMDPDVYAIHVEQIIQTGDTGYIASDFYSQAPLFPILSAVSSLFTGLPASDAMAVYPLLTALVTGFFTYIIGREVATQRVGLIAAALAAVAADVTISGYIPIAQTLGVFYFITVIYLFQRYLGASRGNEAQRYVLSFLVLLVAMIFTHRLPLVILLLFVAALFIATFVPKFLPVETLFRGTKSSILVLGTLVFCLFVVQYIYLTTYISGFILSIASLFGELSPASPSVTTAPDAENVYSGLFWALVRRANALTMLLIGGCSWLAAVYHWRDRSAATPYLVVTGVLFVLFPLSVVATESLRYTRLQRAITPFLIVFIVAILVTRSEQWRPSVQTVASVASAMLLMLVLVTQLTTPTAAPDNSLSYRFYLTDEEVAAKEFGHTFAEEPVHADDYFAHEEPHPARAVREDGWVNTDRADRYQSLEDRLFDREFLADCPGNVVYRAADIYRYSGSWRLTYDLEAALQSSYSKTYSNGGVSLYPDCTTE